MLTRIDKLIIILIVIASLVSIPIAMSASSNNSNPTIAVFRAGKRVASHSMISDKTVRIAGSQGGYCLLQIKNGEASIIKSTCPFKICQKMGQIENNGQTIVCAPMRLLYQIKSGQSNYLDAVNE